MAGKKRDVACNGGVASFLPHMQHFNIGEQRTPGSLGIAGLSRSLPSWEFDIGPDLFIDILAGAVIVKGYDGNACVFFDPRRHCLRDEAGAAEGRVGLDESEISG